MSTTNFSDLDPDSPEYEAAVEAAQAEEDAQREAEGITPPAADGVDDKPEEGEPADAKPTEQPSPEAEAEAAAVAKEEAAAKVAGVASKDGSTVLPYAALQAERRAARRERNAREQAEREREELRQQLADLKAGKKPEPDGPTDEELAELAVDVPAVAKLVEERKRLREQNEALAKQVPAKPAAEEEDDPTLEAIDMVPELVKWRSDGDMEKLQRAGVIDDVLKTSPKWKDLPGTVENLAKRFKAAARMVAEEYGEAVEDKAPTPPPPSRPDPKQVIAATAKRTAPNTLSDFKGGNADPTDERIEKMSPTRMLDRFSSMTDAEIDAHLARLG